MPENTRFIEEARRVLRMEARAVADLEERLGKDFDTACGLCLKTEGRVVVTGMGKSGHVAGKIAATLASTGTPAFFMHTGEAGHGDLGMITPEDVVIALSNSGETEEIVRLLPMLRNAGVPLIAMTGQEQSTLARHATAVLDIEVREEACPLNLAPTSQHHPPCWRSATRWRWPCSRRAALPPSNSPVPIRAGGWDGACWCGYRM